MYMCCSTGSQHQALDGGDLIVVRIAEGESSPALGGSRARVDIATGTPGTLEDILAAIDVVRRGHRPQFRGALAGDGNDHEHGRNHLSADLTLREERDQAHATCNARLNILVIGHQACVPFEIRKTFRVSAMFNAIDPRRG